MPSVIQQLCDPCFANEEHVEGSPHVLTMEGIERVLILCGPHEDEVLKPLLALLQEYGAKPTPTQPLARPKYSPRSPEAMAFGTVPLPNDLTASEALELIERGRCPFDPKGEGPFANKAAVGSHIRNQHGVSLTQLGLGRRGGLPIDADKERGDYECDVCHNHFMSAQAVGAHRSRSHGIKSTKALATQQRADRAAASPNVVAQRERSTLIQSNGKLQCPDCTKQFQTMQGLKRHRENTHVAGLTFVFDTEMQQCPDCDASFDNGRKLGSHRHRVHGYRSTTSGAERKRRAREAKAASA